MSVSERYLGLNVWLIVLRLSVVVTFAGCGVVVMNFLSDRNALIIYLLVIPIITVTAMYSEMFLWFWVAVVTVISVYLTFIGE